MVSMTFYLATVNDPDLKAVMSNLCGQTPIANTVSAAQEILSEYDINIQFTPQRLVTPNGEEMSCQKLTKVVKRLQWKKLEATLNAKTVHGTYARQVKAKGYDRRQTWRWLERFPGYSSTEALILAAQDGVLLTKAYCSRILGHGTGLTCRKCKKNTETIGHILSSCPTYQWTLYKERHDKCVHVLAKSLAASTHKK